MYAQKNSSNEYKSSPKIAIVLGAVKHGGVEYIAMNYLKYINIHSEIHVFSSNGKKLPFYQECFDKGIRFIDLPPIRHIVQYYHVLSSYCQKEQYGIMHSHLSTLSLFPLGIARYHHIPVRICHNHSTAHWGEGIKTLAKYLLKPWVKMASTDYWACGESSARWMYKNLSDVHVIPNAIDIQSFSFNGAERARLRQELGLHEENFVLGHVGRFVYQKNHRFLLKIFSAVLQENPHAKLLLMGEGPLQQSMRQEAEKLRISSHVHFMGTRNDMPSLYSALDAFILPSFYEGLPLVGVEAQANGLPCFFSEHVCPEIVLTPNSKRLPLTCSPQRWAKACLSGKRLAEPGLPPEYDIRVQAPLLAQHYARLFHRQKL